jgi:hypothetical protein
VHARIAGVRDKVRGMRAWILALVAAASACKDDKLTWKKHELHSFELDGVRFDIPKGWRDLRESDDPRLARMTRRLGADAEAHILVREDAENTNSNISVMLSELNGAPTCDQFAAAMGAEVDRSTVLPQKYGNDPGCSFWIKDGKSEGKTFLRFRGTKFITVQCLRPLAGDAKADATCEDVVTGMAAK